MDGSHRLTLRNRKFLRKFTQFNRTPLLMSIPNGYQSNSMENTSDTPLDSAPDVAHSSSTERPHGTPSNDTSTTSDTQHDTAPDMLHDTASDTQHTAPDMLHDARHGVVPDATRRAARDNQQPAPMLSPRRSNRTRKPNVRLEGYQW